MTWSTGASELAAGGLLLAAISLSYMFLRPKAGREAAVFRLPGATVVVNLLLVMLILIALGLLTNGWNALR